MPEPLEFEDTEELALSYAKEWARLPPQHLRVALKTLEPVMMRRHELAVMREQNRHRLWMAGLLAGGVTSLGSIGGAILFGLLHDPLMAGVMLSPSVFAVTKMFVLRKSEKSDMRAARSALGSVTQQGGPPPAI
ncbi:MULTISPECIES: hypothetical protein [Streptomyces]|uniref:DUF2335 domain-containing protein n=1 Tax=Streptomyces edwardsiae TaxID=3075527 RepID=A0ABU2QN87_9ACTN|nr:MULTISPECIES: hypothetical protein [unclassified Streptomyces]MDT0405923.1 hypothetical protein [Streptomyces sp. DSM 41635]